MMAWKSHGRGGGAITDAESRLLAIEPGVALEARALFTPDPWAARDGHVARGLREPP
jgi:hypothetical protein